MKKYYLFFIICLSVFVCLLSGCITAPIINSTSFGSTGDKFVREG